MVTIADVARAAGVSTSTVSYVLSGKRPISLETRRRVERSINELGFRPNAGARALASSRTNVLAVVVPFRADVIVPVIMQFVASMVVTARTYDHDVLLLTRDEGNEGLSRVVGSALCDGIVVMDVESDEPRVPLLRSLGRPAVLVGVPDDTSGLACVDLDFEATGSLCLSHLAELGHRDIALIGPSPEVFQRGTSFAKRFLRGFSNTARERGVRATSHPCAPSYEAVCEFLDKIGLRERAATGSDSGDRPTPTGLVVQNEAVLPSVLTVLHRRGFDVPADISIVAVCPDNIAENQHVRLTAVAIPAVDVGRVAIEMVMRQLGGDPLVETRLLAPRLTVRDSTRRHG